MTVLTTLVNDPAPGASLLDTAPIATPAPGTQLIASLQWNNLLDLLRGTSVDEIDLNALEAITINRAVETDAGGHLIASAVTNTELNLLSGATALELQANKGAVSGYAGLDASQLLLLANFPAGSGLDVLRRNAGNTALEFAAPAVPTLEALTDTTITAVAANEVLVRNAGNTAWINDLLVDANIDGAAAIAQSKLNLAITNAELAGGLYRAITGASGTFNLLTDNATSVLELEANHTTPASQDIGQIDWIDDDSVGNRTIYAQIKTTIENPTDLAEDGEMTISVMESGALTNYFLLNFANSNAIDVVKDIRMNNNLFSSVSQIGFQNTTMSIEGSGASFLNYEVGANEWHFFRGNGGDPIVSMGGGAGPSMQMSTASFQLSQGADVASVAAMTLGTDGNYFNITGTTNISTISSATFQNGSIIHLKFDGVLTITHGTGSNQVDFADNQNYTTAPGDVLTLVRDFAVWVEVSRSKQGLSALTSNLDAAGFDITNVGLLHLLIDNTTAVIELEANHTTPTIGQIIGQFDFYDDDSLGTRTLYARISSTIEDDTSPTEDGSINFSAIQNGSLLDFMTINDNAGTAINIKRPFILESIGAGITNNSQHIANLNNVMIFNVQTAESYEFRVQGANEYDYDATRADFNNNNLINARLTTGNQVNGALTWGEFRQIFNPSATIAGINVGAHTADPTVPVNGDIFYNSTTNKFRFRENAAWVEVGGEVTTWTALHDAARFNHDNIGASIYSLTGASVAPLATDPYITFDPALTPDALVINAPTTNEIILAIAGVEEYTFSSSILGGNGNILQNFSSLQLAAATDTIFRIENTASNPTNGTVLGTQEWRGDTVGGGSINYAEAQVIMVDTAVAGADAEYSLSVFEGGALTEYIALNESAQADITFKKPIAGMTMVDATNIILNATTGTKIGTATTQKLGFFNATPVIQPTALTTALTTMTSVGPGTPDYAIQAATSTTPFGFVTADEMETVLTVIINNQARINELETKLQALGLIA